MHDDLREPVPVRPGLNLAPGSPRSSVALACSLLLALILTACAGGGGSGQSYMAPTKVTSSSRGSVRSHQIEPYNGPKARVAVMDFEDKSGMWGGDKAIGSGLKEQLVTALSQSGAFIVLERDRMEDVLIEQEMAGTGRFRDETVARMGDMEGAEFLIYGAVTEYQPDEAGADLTTAYANPTGALVSTLIDAAFKQDHVAIDIRLVDARTGRIVNATSVEGKARDLGGGIEGQFTKVLVGTSGNYRTPMQKSVRACMIRAVNWIAENAFAEGVHRPYESAPASTPAANSGPAQNTTSSSASSQDQSAESGTGNSTPIMSLSTKAEAAQLRFNPTATSTAMMALPEGTKVNVLGGENGWVKVNLPGTDVIGWINQSDFN